MPEAPVRYGGPYRVALHDGRSYRISGAEFASHWPYEIDNFLRTPGMKRILGDSDFHILDRWGRAWGRWCERCGSDADAHMAEIVDRAGRVLIVHQDGCLRDGDETA